MKLTDITIGTRHRKEVGNLTSLVASMKDVGLLHPVIVNSRRELIAGARRLEAAKRLGWEEIDARVCDTLDEACAALRAERDENICRKDFLPSEAVAIGRELEKIEKEAAQKRIEASQGNRQSGSVKFTGPEKGNVRDKVGEAVGMSGVTYQRAKAVVTRAAENPKKYGDLVESMDKSGKVMPAFQEATRRAQAVVTEDNANSLRPVKQRIKIGKGIELAQQAIGILRRIPDDDPLRSEGLNAVSSWINENR